MQKQKQQELLLQKNADSLAIDVRSPFETRGVNLLVLIGLLLTFSLEIIVNEVLQNIMTRKMHVNSQKFDHFSNKRMTTDH